MVDEGGTPADDYCPDTRQHDAAGWVLDALEPGEADRFSAHLFTCRACQLIVEELEVAARMLLGSGIPPPPARLKPAVLGRVRLAARQPRKLPGHKHAMAGSAPGSRD